MHKLKTGILLVILAACTTGPQETARPTSTTGENTATASATSTITPSPTLSQTPTPVIYPNLVSRCPEPREIPFEEMGFDGNTAMLVSFLDEAGEEQEAIISGSDPIPQPIPALPLEDNEYQYRLPEYDGRISPDGKWIVYGVNDTTEGDEYAIWVSSLDGAEYWEVKTLHVPEVKGWYYPRLEWHSASELVLYETLYETIEIYELKIRKINIFSGETVQLSPNPDWVTFSLQDFNAPTQYFLYYGAPPGTSLTWWADDYFYLYDHYANTVEIAFPWLGEDYVNIWDPYFFGTSIMLSTDENQEITLILGKPQGLDLAIDLSYEQIVSEEEYDAVMQKVEIDDGETWTTLDWVHDPRVGFFRHHSIFEKGDRENFYIYEWNTDVLFDYCLPPNYGSSEFEFDNALSKSDIALYNDVSINGHYTAWSDVEPCTPCKLIATYVMDLATGYISRIPDVQFKQWFELPEG